MKYIVKSKVTNVYWYAPNKGATHLRSRAHRYTREELAKHMFKEDINKRDPLTGKRTHVIIPVGE